MKREERRGGICSKAGNKEKDEREEQKSVYRREKTMDKRLGQRNRLGKGVQERGKKEEKYRG